MLFALVLRVSLLCSIENVEVDVVVTLEVLEKLIHLVVDVDGNTFLVGLLFSQFLLDCADVGILERFLKHFLHESGDNSALQPKKFADIISQMLQILFRQMIAPEVHRCERRHGIDSPYLGIVM